MGYLNPDSATTTDMLNQVEDYSVSNADTTSQTQYTMNWKLWHGYYVAIPELQTVIDRKAMWTVGKGYTAKPDIKSMLKRIRGCGKDTFNSLLDNCIKVYTQGGDSFCERITNRNETKLKNLKPLNPGTMTIHANGAGIIKKYTQMTETGEDLTFRPEEIFHLAWNRAADSIHGTGTIAKLENIILMRNEAMDDLKTVFHRYVKPLIISAVDTDDETEIATYKAKIDSAVKNGENLVVPKGVLDKMERMSIPQYSTLDPLPWMELLHRHFIIAEGVPEVILGNGQDTTEATSKILYLAFQQMVEWNQQFLMEQIEAQLGLEIKLKFPASIAPALLEQGSKERSMNNMEMGHDAKK